MAVVERARRAAEERLEAIRALPIALLRVIFDSGICSRWSKRTLPEVAVLLPSRSIASDGDAEVLAITSACLSESGFLPSGIKEARMCSEHVDECTVQEGEVLVARSNTPELVGRASMYEGNPPGITASDLTIRIWADASQMKPAFLSAYLTFLYQTGYWRERAGGASGSMKKVTRTQLLNLEIPVPALSEQDDIIRRLNSELAISRSAFKAAEAELSSINALPAALLREAFAGQL